MLYKTTTLKCPIVKPKMSNMKPHIIRCSQDTLTIMCHWVAMCVVSPTIPSKTKLHNIMTAFPLQQHSKFYAKPLFSQDANQLTD